MTMNEVAQLAVNVISQNGLIIHLVSSIELLAERLKKRAQKREDRSLCEIRSIAERYRNVFNILNKSFGIKYLEADVALLI